MILSELDILREIGKNSNKLLDRQCITDQNSIMYDAYCEALTAIKSVVDRSESWDSEHCKDNTGTDVSPESLYGYIANVVALCAARGTGKTSAMLSIANALQNAHNPTSTPIESGALWHSVVDGRSFYVLPPLDPTMLSKRESVINLILSQLFLEISEVWKSGSTKKSALFSEQRRVEILKEFKICQDCLCKQAIPGDKESSSADLAVFLESGDIFTIKTHLVKIIQYYFELKGSGKTKPYLIIQLDDTDMDLENAYSVLEEVRKYLSIPYVVVLMATYLRQLRNLIGSHYAKYLPDEHPTDPKAEMIRLSRMAARYIDKVIPAPQAIHLPSFHEKRNNSGSFTVRELAVTSTELNGISEELAGKDIEDLLFEQIKARTGIVFVRHYSYVHNIVPTTLRGISHLFQLLYTMKELSSIEDPKEKVKERQKNLILFESYFRNDWCPSMLTRKAQDALWDLNEAYISLKLIITYNILSNNFSKKVSLRNPDKKPSFLEIFQYLNECEVAAKSMDEYNLLFAIRMHLSIQLHKLICEDQYHYHLEEVGSGQYTSGEEEFIYAPEFTRTLKFLHISPDDMPKDDANPELSYFKDRFVGLKLNEAGYGKGKFESLFYFLYSLLNLRKYGGALSIEPSIDSAKMDEKPLPQIVEEIQNYSTAILANSDVLQAVYEELSKNGCILNDNVKSKDSRQLNSPDAENDSPDALTAFLISKRIIDVDMAPLKGRLEDIAVFYPSEPPIKEEASPASTPNPNDEETKDKLEKDKLEIMNQDGDEPEGDSSSTHPLEGTP